MSRHRNGHLCTDCTELVLFNTPEIYPVRPEKDSGYAILLYVKQAWSAYCRHFFF